MKEAQQKPTESQITDLSKTEQEASRRERAKEEIERLLHWSVIGHLILLAGVGLISYVNVTAFLKLYAVKSGTITGSLLTFNGLVLSLLVAFATIYLPVMQEKKDKAYARAKDVDEKRKARKSRAVQPSKRENWEEDFVFAGMYGQYAIQSSEYRDRMRLFAALLTIVSVTLGMILLDSYYFFLNSPTMTLALPFSWFYVFAIISPAITVGDVILILVFVIRDVTGTSSTLKTNKEKLEQYILTETGFKVSIGKNGHVEIVSGPLPPPEQKAGESSS